MTGPDRFRTFRSTIEIPLTVRADGPLLIKGPSASLPDRPDDAFVRYPTIEFGPLPYLPGSSLKGVLRSGSEALLRALERPVCNPLEQREQCTRQTGAAGTPGIWQDRCAACFTYGSVKGAGVCMVEDGLPWRPDTPEPVRAARAAELEQRSVVRTSVAVDRQTGAAHPKTLFDYEVLVGVTFHPTIRLRNPRPWEAALVAAVLGLLDEGTLRVGSGTTRGLGRVHAIPDAVVISSLGTDGLTDLLDAGQFTIGERAALLQVRHAQDPAATLRAWSAQLGAWLPQTAPVGDRP